MKQHAKSIIFQEWQTAMSSSIQTHRARSWLAAAVARHTTYFLCSRISCEDAAEVKASPLSVPGGWTVFGEFGVEEGLPSLPSKYLLR
jgi:hypothetical protein